MAHAAPNSEVGQIAAYASAVNAINTAPTVSARSQAITDAAKALSKAANKSVTVATVTALNTQLGLHTSTTTTKSIATQAAAMQTTR